MTRLLLVSGAAGLLFVVGCAALIMEAATDRQVNIGIDPSEVYLASDYPARKPRTVAVMPIDDRRQSENYGRGAGLEGTIEDALSNRGYKVIKVKQTKRQLQEAGVTEDMVPAQSDTALAALLSVDALLKTRLDTYECRIDLPTTETDSLALECSLVDGHTGDVLWRKAIRNDAKVTAPIKTMASGYIGGWTSSLFATLPKAK